MKFNGNKVYKYKVTANDLEFISGHSHIILLFRGTTQCKRMPFVLSDCRYVDKYIIARPKIEMRWSLYH